MNCLWLMHCSDSHAWADWPWWGNSTQGFVSFECQQRLYVWCAIMKFLVWRLKLKMKIGQHSIDSNLVFTSGTCICWYVQVFNVLHCLNRMLLACKYILTNIELVTALSHAWRWKLLVKPICVLNWGLRISPIISCIFKPLGAYCIPLLFTVQHGTVFSFCSTDDQPASLLFNVYVALALPRYDLD